MPAIVSDIDGVLLRGKNIIPGSDNLLKRVLNETFTEHKLRMPFVLLTNGGGMLESDKAKQMNEILGVDLSSDHIILNFTPLRPLV
jgi:ribonucleotide monophosphatase NagD (HAD superfamily)